MSVLPSATNTNLTQPWFAQLGILPTSVNPTCAISTMTSDHIVLDGQGLDCSSAGGGTLLINGVALATVNQNVSSIANWAQFPALSSITYSGGGGTGGLINMTTGQFSTINNTSSIQVGTGNFSTLNATSTVMNSLSTVAGRVNGLTVSTLNGQTVNSLGQNILYRASSQVSTVTFNSSVPNNVITSFANPLSGLTAQGVVNMFFSGTVGTSNSSGNAPLYNAFISDNNVSPYLPINAVGGTFYEQFYPCGPTFTGSGTGSVDLSIQVPFAFSNSPATLFVIWAEQNQAPNIPTLATNNLTATLLSVVGGGTITAV